MRDALAGTQDDGAALHENSATPRMGKDVRDAQPPPMPSLTLPVPLQFGHVPPACALPVPLQAGQRSSPVPGVPGGASSPGLVGSFVDGFMGISVVL
jgi:hypothetical protein